MEVANYVYYRNDDNEFTIYDIDEDTFTYDSDLPRDCNNFELLGKKFERSEEGLKAFATKLVSDNDDVKSIKIMNRTFDIFQCAWKKRDGTIDMFYKNNRCITMNFFKRFSCYSQTRDYTMLEIDECNTMDKCYNAGILHGPEQPIECDGYAYDFQMMYPRCLASQKFYFPTESGKWIYFTKLKKEYKYGMYNCKITIHNKKIRKFVMVSREDYCTHYDLQIIEKVNKIYPGSVTVEPLGYAYVYEKETLEQGYDIFGPWYNALLELKTKFPKNIVVKMISSSLWGYLCQRNSEKIRVDDPRLDDMVLALGLEDEDPDATHYMLDYTECYKNPDKSFYDIMPVDGSPQKHPFRLKPFITAFARLEMVKALVMQPDNILKINTDGFILKTKFKDKIKTLIYEGHHKFLIKNCTRSSILETYEL